MKTKFKMVVTLFVFTAFAILAIASGETKEDLSSTNRSEYQSDTQSENSSNTNSYREGISFSADESGKVTGKPGTNVFGSRDASIDFSSGSVDAQGIVDYSSSNCRLENRYDSRYHLYMFRGSSFSFNVNMPSDASSASLSIRHLTSASGDQSGYSPITLYINGNRVANWSSLNSSYQDDDFNIQSYVNAGNNRIKLEYSPDSGSTGYWIKSIRVRY